MAVLVEREFDHLIVVATMGIREERRGPLVDPLDRTAKCAGRMRDANVFWEHRRLHAKRAAGVVEDGVHLVRRHFQHFRGSHFLAERALSAGVNRETLRRLVIARDETARLHRRDDDARIAQRHFHHMRGAFEGGRDLLAVSEMPVGSDVAGHVVINLWRIRVRAVARGRHRGQGIDIDLDCFRSVFALIDRLGDHAGDRVTDEAHFVRR